MSEITSKIGEVIDVLKEGILHPDLSSHDSVPMIFKT